MCDKNICLLVSIYNILYQYTLFFITYQYIFLYDNIVRIRLLYKGSIYTNQSAS